MIDDFDNSNATQSKIMKLLDDLRNPQNNPDTIKSNDVSSSKIKQFKAQMKTKFEALHEKVGTASAYLSQVQKQANQIVEYKRKLRMNVKFEQNIQEIQNEAKQYYVKLQEQKDQLFKKISNSMLQIKMMEVEQKQRIKHQIEFSNKQLIEESLLRLKKAQSRQKQELTIPELQLSAKIKSLKRSIEEDSYKNKQHLKTIKSGILQMCDKMESDINKQQSALKQSFDFHYQTFEKLVASITQKIK